MKFQTLLTILAVFSFCFINKTYASTRRTCQLGTPNKYPNIPDNLNGFQGVFVPGCSDYVRGGTIMTFENNNCGPALLNFAAYVGNNVFFTMKVRPGSPGSISIPANNGGRFDIKISRQGEPDVAPCKFDVIYI
jgi:hypothetical protein